ncbi:MAG TPA: glucan biosynthesis protein G [Thermodesulfobacteriota bacterium]|nr:glucan biosynthesis protein G [Thermodesulfobacteriota bacterium]
MDDGFQYYKNFLSKSTLFPILCFYLAMVFILSWFLIFPGPTLSATVSKVKKTFTFENVVAKARDLAHQSFQISEKEVPEFLLRINYNAWRDIRFKPEKALWVKEKLPFTVQFFHPGFYYNRLVAINVVEPSGVKQIPFSPALFDYGKNDFYDKVPPHLGFAGFRLHYPINTKTYYDEVVVFLGASYFRAVAQNQNYGLSARGLAINTALPSGEEFPYFKEFWLVKPSPGVKHMTVFALLDSPSLTGAYSFIIVPGKETSIKVKSTLFMRQKVEKLGIAPLTSMFFYGENTSIRPADDFRPEVHDSDGLMIALRSGEWLWRPLKNPQTLLINSFMATNPIGFGLMQRDLDFDHYQDLEAHYEKRPSAWITPIGSWGSGHIELIQIPMDNEWNNNIIAFWVPSIQAEPGQKLSFAYTMDWQFSGGTRPPDGRVIATRTARGKDDLTKKIIIDFAGGRLESLPSEKKLEAVITVDPRATLVEHQLIKNEVTKGWRVVFQVRFEEQGLLERILAGKKPALELRAFLREGDKVLTETWSYAY